VPERATVLSRNEKSAEAVVATGLGRRAEREGEQTAMSLGTTVPQKPGQLGRPAGGRGEAGSEVGLLRVVRLTVELVI
jgi:hypothetical protein